MKRLKTTKIAWICLIMMAVVLVMPADPAYAVIGDRPNKANPFGDPPSDSMPPGYGNNTVQKAQEAAKTAVQAPSPSRVDPTIVEPPVSVAPAVKPGVEANALAIPSLSTPKPLKVTITGDALYNKNSTGVNAADDKTNLKVAPLKETIVIKPDTAPMLPVQTIDDKEKPDIQDIAFKPMTDKNNLSKEDMEAIDSLKAVMKDLKGLETFAEFSKVKEANDKIAQMANMINSDKENMKLFYENNEIGGMFKELSDNQKLLMLKYEKSTEPYYDVIRSMLVKNITVIQVAGIIKQITEEDIKKMPRGEIDKIIEKLRKAKDKSLAKEYILQREARYRGKYINPNAKKMAREMVKMLDDFTKKVSVVIK